MGFKVRDTLRNRIMPWGKKARDAARRAQRVARDGAIRTQEAAGQLAAKFRRAGQKAALHVIALQKMSGLAEEAPKIVHQSAAAVLERENFRKHGPLPDPAWRQGYEDIVRAKLPEMFPPVPRKPDPQPELEA
jgi:hypothetical protein